MFLMMLDGGFEFTAKLNGRPLVPLAHAAERVLPAPGARARRSRTSCRRASSARPATSTCAAPTTRTRRAPRTPLADYTGSARARSRPEDAPGLFHDNVSMLLETRPLNAAARAGASPGTTAGSRRASRSSIPRPCARTRRRSDRRRRRNAAALHASRAPCGFVTIVRHVARSPSSVTSMFDHQVLRHRERRRSSSRASRAPRGTGPTLPPGFDE